MPLVRVPSPAFAGLCVVAALTTAVAAPRLLHADEKLICADAYERAQELRREGKLRESRAQLLVCGRPSCPEVAHKACVAWLTEVQESMPTVVLEARDQDGHELTQVRVLVDGQPLVEAVDGRAVDIDPGVHLFRYELQGATPVEQQVTIREGEKNRKVTVVFDLSGAGPVEEPAAPDPPPRMGRLTYALAAAGLVAVGSFGYFGVTALARESDLRATCSRPCPEEKIQAVRNRQIAADVSLGVAVVSVSAAAWLVLRGGPPSRTGEPRAFVSSAPHGAIVGMHGAF
jgi:hypothetical protein